MTDPREPLRLLGAKVRALRKQRGLSQEALAAEAGFDRTYVSLVERGQRNIALLNILRLARALNVHPASLLEGF
jgi:transcriptional regulator with XRE-family HTH domain